MRAEPTARLSRAPCRQGNALVPKALQPARHATAPRSAAAMLARLRALPAEDRGSAPSGGRPKRAVRL